MVKFRILASVMDYKIYELVGCMTLISYKKINKNLKPSKIHKSGFITYMLVDFFFNL